MLFQNIIIITQAATKYTRGADGFLTAHWEDPPDERTWKTQVPNAHLSGDGLSIIRPQAVSVMMRRPAAAPVDEEEGEDEDVDELDVDGDPLEDVKPKKPKKRAAKSAASPAPVETK